MTIRNLILAIVTLSLFHGMPVDASTAKCNAKTLKAAALHSGCVMKATAANWLRPNGTKFAKRISRCEARITRAFNRAQRVHGREACTTESPASYIQANIQFSNVVANVTSAQGNFELCSPSQVDLVGGTCGTLLGVAAGEIPGCDGTPYIEPNAPLTAGAWLWDKDPGAKPDIQSYLAWGTSKQSVGLDMLNDAGAASKAAADKRISAIQALNASSFQMDSGSKATMFKLTYVYSEDIALQYPVGQVGITIAQLDSKEVIFFNEGMESAGFVTGTVNGNDIDITGKPSIDISSSLDQVHLKAAYDAISYWLTELQTIGVGADCLASFDLALATTPAYTDLAMLLAARYNVYARAQNPALPTYNYFNLDSEPSSDTALQATYLAINKAILQKYGPGTDFKFPIAAYVNQGQNQDGFTAEACGVSQGMIFGGYRSTPASQCEQASTLCDPSTAPKCANHAWTMAWEGSLTPKGVHTPPSPMCNEATVANVREMADIAIAQAGGCSTPMTVDANPQVGLSSFLPIYAQLVQGGYTCP